MSDQEGKLTRYRYDGLGRLVDEFRAVAQLVVGVGDAADEIVDGFAARVVGETRIAG